MAIHKEGSYGPYRALDRIGAGRNGKPVWLAYSNAEKRHREVTEKKLAYYARKDAR